MLYNFLMIVHVLVVIALIGVILIQRGRSGGLVEALGGVESIFGTKTNSVIVKVTIGLAIAFFTTSITLAFISKQQGKSVMERIGDSAVSDSSATPVPPVAENVPAPTNVPADAQP